MSNTRKPGMRNTYRAEFLHSLAWFARRDRWFRRQEQLDRPLVCAVCERLAVPRELELHHADYSGVSLVHGRWRAYEDHDDLIPMHHDCHERLHRLIEADYVLSHLRTRRAATHTAIAKLRTTRYRQEAAR